jgi:hypothetical protein
MQAPLILGVDNRQGIATSGAKGGKSFDTIQTQTDYDAV